ncbi:hypothetical protein D3C73_1675640 [compost metagenome]
MSPPIKMKEAANGLERNDGAGAPVESLAVSEIVDMSDLLPATNNEYRYHYKGRVLRKP